METFQIGPVFQSLTGQVKCIQNFQKSQIVSNISKCIQFDTKFSSSFHFPLVIFLHTGSFPEIFFETLVFGVFEASDPLKSNC